MKPTNEDGSEVQPLVLIEVPTPLPFGHAYRGPNDMSVLESMEYGEWHLSVSQPDRYPTWDELRDVCWALHPGYDFKVQIPRQNRPYLNAHPHCLHLRQDPDFKG